MIETTTARAIGNVSEQGPAHGAGRRKPFVSTSIAKFVLVAIEISSEPLGSKEVLHGSHF